MAKGKTNKPQSNADESLPSTPQSAPPAPARPDDASISEQPGELTPPPVINAREFEAGFGDTLDQTLDLENWQSGLVLCADWDRIEQELGEALEQARRNVLPIRNTVFPLIASRHNAPKGA